MAALPDASVVTTEDVGRFIWPPGADLTAWDSFRAPVAGRPVDPAKLPLPELVGLARQCLARGLPDEVTPIAMRDACGLQRLRETSRNTTSTPPTCWSAKPPTS